MVEKLPTIIDNRGDNTLLHALQRLLPGVQGLDITTGLFEIGSFLLLEQLWQRLDKIRILMGDETTRRTKKEIVESLRKKSDASIEGEKERDDALTGLPAFQTILQNPLGLLFLFRFFPNAKISRQLAKSLIANCECLARTL